MFVRLSKLFSVRFSAYLKLGRFHSLSGAFYLLVPCWWGLALALPDVLPDFASDVSFGQASPFLLPLSLALLFALAATAARAAGCAWNDLCDCTIDKQTERTRTRPLPSGELSKRQALLFVLLALFVCGACLLGLLVLAENPFLLLLLVCAILPIAAFYPLAKRVVSAPQFVLGIAFNWGILCAYAALAGNLNSAAWSLWLGAIAWTAFYDSIYAWQDIQDDRRTKMNSLTLWLEKKQNPKLWLKILYAFFLASFLVSVFLALSPTFEANLNIWQVGFWLFCLPLLILLARWCYADLARCNLRKPQECMAFFRKECWRTGGGILLLLLLATCSSRLV